MIVRSIYWATKIPEISLEERKVVMIARKMIAALWNDRHSDRTRDALRLAIRLAKNERDRERRRKSFYTVRKA